MLLPNITKRNFRKSYFHNFIPSTKYLNIDSLSTREPSNSFSNQNSRTKTNFILDSKSNFNNKPDIYKLYSEEKYKNINLTEPKFPYKPHPKIKDTRILKTKFRRRNISDDNNFIKIKLSSTDNLNKRFSTQIKRDLDNLIIQKLNKEKKEHNQRNNKNNNNYLKIENLEEFRNFIIKKNNKEQIKNLSLSLIEKIEKFNNEKEENIPYLKITNNYYFDKIINRVIRKVIYYSDKNEKIKNDYVMNLLYEEGNYLELETNKNMELHCNIKNFSTVVLQNDYKITLIPLINKVKPLSEKEINNLNESIYKTELIKNKKIQSQHHENNKNNNNNLNEVNEDNSLKNSNDNLNHGGIWDLYNKEQNKKKRKSAIKNFGFKVNVENNNHDMYFNQNYNPNSFNNEKDNKYIINHKSNINENNNSIQLTQEKNYENNNLKKYYNNNINNNIDLNNNNKYINDNNDLIINNKHFNNSNSDLNNLSPIFNHNLKINQNYNYINSETENNTNNNSFLYNNYYSKSNLNDKSNLPKNIKLESIEIYDTKSKESLTQDTFQNIKNNNNELLNINNNELLNVDNNELLNVDNNELLNIASDKNQLNENNNLSYKKKKNKLEKKIYEENIKNILNEKENKENKNKKQKIKNSFSSISENENEEEKKNNNNLNRKKIKSIENKKKKKKKREIKEEEIYDPNIDYEQLEIERKLSLLNLKKKSISKYNYSIKQDEKKENKNELIENKKDINLKLSESYSSSSNSQNESSFSSKKEEEKKVEIEKVKTPKKNTWGLSGIILEKNKNKHHYNQSKYNPYNYNYYNINPNNSNNNNNNNNINNNNNNNDNITIIDTEDKNNNNSFVSIEKKIDEIERNKKNTEEPQSEIHYSSPSNRYYENRNLKMKNTNLLKEIDKLNEKRRQIQRKRTIRRTINLDYNNPKSKYYREKKENEIEKKETIKTKLNTKIRKINKIEEADANTKIKDLKIIEEIKFKMTQEMSAEGKQMYADLLNQISKLKESDINAYINSLENGFEPFKEEIDAIANARLIEERLNLFIDNLNRDRKYYEEKRNTLAEKIKVKDYKFENTFNSIDESLLIEKNEDFIF